MKIKLLIEDLRPVSKNNIIDIVGDNNKVNKAKSCINS